MLVPTVLVINVLFWFNKGYFLRKHRATYFILLNWSMFEAVFLEVNAAVVCGQLKHWYESLPNDVLILLQAAYFS